MALLPTDRAAPGRRARAGRAPRQRDRVAAALLAAAAGCHIDTTERHANGGGQDPDPSGPRYLRLYKESHFRALGEHFVRGVTRDGFLAALRSSRVLYLGDHHADRDLHRQMLELLAAVEAAGERVHLGLECIGEQDEPVVTAYLTGGIDFATLVQAMRARWPDTWLARATVDAEFYGALLRRARTERTPVFALEPTPRLPLMERDAVIAAAIRERARLHPDALVVVVVGHTHLLGYGRLVDRVGLPHVAVGARLSVALARQAARSAFAPDHAFAVATSRVHFFLPLSPAEAD